MSGRIPQDFIEELLARTDIVEIIESRLTLKKTGQNYSGLCPFHNEKTPSFSVSADKQFYYCFGCQESGSALRFIMEHDRMEFVAAVEYLAQRLGLEVPKTDKGKTQDESRQEDERRKRKKSLYDVLNLANAYYKKQLREHPGRDQVVKYLKNRGMTGHVARDYDLGFAPPGWDNLMQALAVTNHDRQLLIESGLLIDLPEEDKTYDRFRDRILFPIKDIRGRVIGFGGRILGDGKPKYLNSPETPVFHKGRELYGLYEARRSSRSLKSMLVVEGYMDVIALSQRGVKNVVATLGTATSRDHLERLYRMVAEVVFCFDGDSAGRKAAWKALEEALPLLRDGRIARFLFLPEGEDPDSLIGKQGPEKFQNLVENAHYLPDFFYEKLASEVDAESMQGKAALSTLAMPLIKRIPQGVFQQLMLGKLAEITGISSDQLVSVTQTGESRSQPRVTSRPQERKRRSDSPAASGSRSHTFVEAALRLVLKQPELISSFDTATYTNLSVLPECIPLLQIAARVNEDVNITPRTLINSFVDADNFDFLKNIAESQVLLSIDGWQIEYMGIIHKLLARLDKEASNHVRQGLKDKPPSAMTTDEKQAYRNAIGKK